MHTSYRTIALASLILTACGAGSSGEEKDKPVTQYRPPNARPDLWGSPEAATFSLSDGKPFTKEDMAATNDLIEYHQRVYLQGATTIAQGFVPKAFLARPGITFQDRTDGEIPGMEKMNAVIKRIQERCGVFLPNRKSGIQLTVTWADQRITNQLTSPNAGGFFMSGAMTAIKPQWDSENAPPRKRLGFFQLASPENDIFINAEGFKEPNGGLRTWPDFFKNSETLKGGLYWEDIKPRSKGDCMAPIMGEGTFADDTFAHELGHAYFTEWALQNGRSTYQTVKFREMLAEIFADICYRDVSTGCVEKWEPRTPGVDQFYNQNEFDVSYANSKLRFDQHTNTVYSNLPFSKERDCAETFDCNELSKMERMRNFANPGERGILNPYDYNLRPFNLTVLAYLKYKSMWKPESRAQTFQALTSTLADMKGEKLPECAPKEAAKEFTWDRAKGPFVPTKSEPHEFAEFCPWGMRESTIRLSEAEKPLVFTAREFYRVFEKHWPLPEEYRAAYESNRDYINAVWEY
jgi:hypothetical protein